MAHRGEVLPCTGFMSRDFPFYFEELFSHLLGSLALPLVSLACLPIPDCVHLFLVTLVFKLSASLFVLCQFRPITPAHVHNHRDVFVHAASARIHHPRKEGMFVSKFYNVALESQFKLYFIAELFISI